MQNICYVKLFFVDVVCIFILCLLTGGKNIYAGEQKYYRLGIDLGGTNIKVGLVDEQGNFVGEKCKCKTNANRDYKLILRDMADCCHKVLNDNKIKIEQVKGIGIGIPGKCDAKKKVIIYACNIKSLNGINIEQELQKFINLPVYIDNDANCAAIGENKFGVSKGYKNSIMITLGTGIGGGIIINNEILPNTEIGHHVINLAGENCSCGRKGCWETYASATGLIREAKIYAPKNPDSKLNSIDKDKIDGKFVFDMAKAGDKTAILVVNNYINYLAEGIANLINIFDSEIFVIGGGISNQGEDLLVKLRESVRKKVYANDLESKIMKSKLGDDAGIIGAAFLA